ncbi:MAG TPA: glucodextranase DOMON-like domain-containing protein [Micromonosporaceae bacterium]
MSRSRLTRISRPRTHRIAATGTLMAALVLAVPLAIVTTGAANGDPAPVNATVAPGAPGASSYFDTARKDCVGTARNSTSKVWFTVADGVLSDVYEPTIDNTDLKSLQFVVTDGSTYTDLQTRDTSYIVSTDPTGMSCTVTSTSATHGYKLSTTYIADPSRDAVRSHTVLQALPGATTDVRALHVYAYLDAHVNGNGGGGTDNGGADTGIVAPSGVGVVGDASTVSQATNRSYAVPTYMALGSPQLQQASVGYAGSASDGLTELDATHTLSTSYASAPDGHIVLTEALAPKPSTTSLSGSTYDLSLGFGRTQASALSVTAASLKSSFAATTAKYLAGWLKYDAGRKKPKTTISGLTTGAVLRAYYLSANVLKASEDKTFPGAIVASLSSPWGQAVNAGTLVGGKPVYFGSYREVFSRDLYEAFTGLLADGDVATAKAATTFLFDSQQLPTGEIPRNSLVNGASAPDTGGDQLDETSYPILMAYLTGLDTKSKADRKLWTDHIKPAADFVVAHGPSFGVERWEEQSGYSPSTIAAEIAGLTAAAEIASKQGDSADALLYHAVADDFQRNVKTWTATTTGPDSSSPYFIRLSKNADPDTGDAYNLGNGVQGNIDQRAVIDGGFQELVRLGELSPTDPVYLNSLSVLDHQISVTTPSGTGYYRYGTSAAAGSADGYGDCYQPSQSSCSVPGEPWPTTDTGTGHLWPVLSGERAESDLVTGDPTAAANLLGFLLTSDSGEGLVPEQVWEDPNLAPSPYGSDPTTASIGFVDGQAAGSASPLTWAQAQELRLITDIGSKKIVDQPSIVADRYVKHSAPGSLAVTITSPQSGSTANGSTETVTGTTAAKAHLTISSIDTDVAGVSASVSAKADAGGAFSVTVPVGFGTNVISVAASSGSSTGLAQVSVVGDLVGGVTVLDSADPANDDNGPGTYQYPTSSSFTAGSFDITDFQVLTKDNVVYLRTTLRSLTPTFGNTIGAQLLDIYVHTGGTDPTSTAAAFPQRNYTIAPADAWSQRLEVQGFASPVWQDAAGNAQGTVNAVVSSTVTNTITVALPEAQFGTPTSGWSFAVVLTGQDGFSPDQARAFAATPQDFAFGVCATGNSSPICSVDPVTVPKAMDVIAPAGVNQSSELDPTAGPVVIQAVPVP